MPRLTAFLLAALAASLFAPAALAQDAAGDVRVLRQWADEVKVDGDRTAVWRFAIVYDAASGETVRTVTDEAGRLVERTVLERSLVAPTAREVQAARRLIYADPELGALIGAARDPAVEGGFVLLREAGHPCGPGSRCLQFDVVEQTPALRRVERLRFVVVDLRAGRVLFDDFDPAAEGNLARPDAAHSH